MNSERTFQVYGAAHLTVIFLTIALPFVLAATVRRAKSGRLERVDVALGSFQASKPPAFAEAPALFFRQRPTLDVIVECDPSSRP